MDTESAKEVKSMRILFLILAALLLTGCAAASVQPTTVPLPEETAAASVAATVPAPTEEAPDLITMLMAGLTVEEKVGQLFLARCPETGAEEALREYHLGGFVLFGRDLEGQNPQSLTDTLAAYRAACTLPPLIAVDEEGGTVNRVSRNPAFRSSPFPSPRAAFASGGLEAVLEAEEEKAALLHSLGINVILGPVCDIATEENAFLYKRSLGQSPEITGQFAAGTATIYQENGLGTVLKHFPGYGNCADTHTGIARDTRTLEALEADLLPFRMAMQAAPCAVMVCHIQVDALDDSYPASLSPAVHDILRTKLGFDGVILTDDLAMGAITDLYGAEEAAVLAVLAGNDLLCSTEYAAQYNAVLEAVKTGRIPMETLDAAVHRVLTWKNQLGILFS